MFVDRQEELAQMNRLYHSTRAELFVLYGRRRVGKTELLRAFCAEKPHLFFIATLSSDTEQLAAFSQHVWRFTHGETLEGFTFPTWEDAFRSLAILPGRSVIVLDEFTYLISGNKAIPSVLQKVWDETLKDANLLLVLCGSYIGMMENEVLGYQAPLYGRRTGSLLLRPFGLAALARFFPGASAEERLRTWGVLGGMPYYLKVFSEQHDLFDNIQEHILNRQGILYNEPRLLLMEELREPRNYFSILRAIAQGHTRLNEIAQSSGVGPVSSTARYLDILQQLHLITRRTPVTESQPEKSKKGIYCIDDHFLRFWFRYVHPNLGSLDIGLDEAVLTQKIQPDFDSFLGSTFEEASRVYTAGLARSGRLSFLPERIGGWWDRDVEIDVAALSESERCLLLGECKWSHHLVGLNVLEDLQRKGRLMMAGYPGWQVAYILFARAGFTPELETRAAQEGIRLVSIQDDGFWK